MDRQGVEFMTIKSHSFDYLKSFTGLIILTLMLQSGMYSQTDSSAQSNIPDKRVDGWTNKLQKELNLSDEQAAKVRDILSSTKNEINTDVNRYNNDIQKDIQDRLDKADSDMMGVLTTNEQKEKYNKLRDDVRSDISPDTTANNEPNDQVVNNYYGNGYNYGWWWYPGAYWSWWYPGYYGRGYYPYSYRSYFGHGYYPYSRYYQHPYSGRGYSRPSASGPRMSSSPRMSASPSGSFRGMSAPRGFGVGRGFGGGGRRGR
jgi:hypothetical protein